MLAVGWDWSSVEHEGQGGGRCTGRLRCDTRCVLAFAYAVFEDLSDHRRVLDAGDNFHCAATVLTGFDVDSERALETSGPGHGTVFFRFCQVRVGGESLTAPCRGDLRAKAAVRGEEPMIAREIDAESGHECRQSGNKIQWLEEDVGGAVSPGCSVIETWMFLAGEKI